ncbi:uncharacterized protein LOC134672092 [Cydia fagiglandana]|uniref:uncharacterized protein LOC134672092 n=1 Tax=Cydia fagiglandana TaxID=1458189 RepID=UPI002FEDF4D9
MKVIIALCSMVVLGLEVASQSGPCGCKPVFEYCANDYTTYHSICEYKCKHPSTPFYDWYILYNGPCISTSETTTHASTTTTRKRFRTTTSTTGPFEENTAGDNLNGYHGATASNTING